MPHTTFEWSWFEQFVVARERPGALHVGVQDDRDEIGGVELARPAADLDVAEAVERERRLPRLRTVAAQRVVVGRLGVAQRAVGGLTVFEHLGVAQRDDRARLAVDGEADAPDEVLAEVEHGRTRRAS